MLLPSYTRFPCWVRAHGSPESLWAQHLALSPLSAPLPLQALEEALNVQASPPPIFASTMEPAGKVPQQELLTQNELLKQQVGQDVELPEAGRELRAVDLPGKEPGVGGSSPAALRGTVLVWGGAGV